MSGKAITITCCAGACTAAARGDTLGVAIYNAGQRGLRRVGAKYYCADHMPPSEPCPHGNGRPDACSQCLGAVPRVVTADDIAGGARARDDMAIANAAARSKRGWRAGRRRSGTREVE